MGGPRWHFPRGKGGMGGPKSGSPRGKWRMGRRRAEFIIETAEPTAGIPFKTRELAARRPPLSPPLAQNGSWQDQSHHRRTCGNIYRHEPTKRG